MILIEILSFSSLKVIFALSCFYHKWNLKFYFINYESQMDRVLEARSISDSYLTQHDWAKISSNDNKSISCMCDVIRMVIFKVALHICVGRFFLGLFYFSLVFYASAMQFFTFSNEKES